MMAKMFYTLEEAAEALGLSPDEVKQLGEDGKLQQFRDRDKVMFKRDHVEKLKASGDLKPGGGGDDDSIDLAGPTDTIDLKEETAKDSQKAEKDRKTSTATGISVFDADEIGLDDPMAQTQVTGALNLDDEELSLESVGSGSGLLDLTRESDDASLGAMELLDDIAGGDSAGELSSLTRSGTGIFDAVDTAAPSGLDNLSQGSAATAAAAAAYYAAEPSDPAGEGFGAAMLVGVSVPIVIGLLVVLASLQGNFLELSASYAKSMPAWGLGMFFGSLFLGLIGFFIGRAKG